MHSSRNVTPHGCFSVHLKKRGVIPVPGVFLNDDDYNFDLALRRFKKQVEKAGRQDLADKENAELVILETYLRKMSQN